MCHLWKPSLSRAATCLNLIGCLFDRCIKPNWYQSPDRFDSDAVLAQVRSLAVVPTVLIRNLGFPVWFPFTVFIERFCVQFKLPVAFIERTKCFSKENNCLHPKHIKLNYVPFQSATYCIKVPSTPEKFENENHRSVWISVWLISRRIQNSRA